MWATIAATDVICALVSYRARLTGRYGACVALHAELPHDSNQILVDAPRQHLVRGTRFRSDFSGSYGARQRRVVSLGLIGISARETR